MRPWPPALPANHTPPSAPTLETAIILHCTTTIRPLVKHESRCCARQSCCILPVSRLCLVLMGAWLRWAAPSLDIVWQALQSKSTILSRAWWRCLPFVNPPGLDELAAAVLWKCDCFGRRLLGSAGHLEVETTPLVRPASCAHAKPENKLITGCPNTTY